MRASFPVASAATKRCVAARSRGKGRPSAPVARGLCLPVLSRCRENLVLCPHFNGLSGCLRGVSPDGALSAIVFRYPFFGTIPLSARALRARSGYSEPRGERLSRVALRFGSAPHGFPQPVSDPSRIREAAKPPPHARWLSLAKGMRRGLPHRSPRVQVGFTATRLGRRPPSRLCRARGPRLRCSRRRPRSRRRRRRSATPCRPRRSPSRSTAPLRSRGVCSPFL